MNGQFLMIGSTGSRHIAEVNNSGAVAVAGYYNDVVHPLLVDNSGALVTSASIGSINAGSTSYLYGKSGTDWYPLAVASGTDGVLRVSTSVSVGSVSLKDGAFVSVMASGTTGFPISGVVTTSIDTAFVTSGNVFIVSGNNWAGVGSTYVSNTVQVSGDVTISDDSYVSVKASGTTGFPISGVVTVNDLATAGSLATQTVNGSVAITTNPVPVSGVITISDDAYVSVASSGVSLDDFTLRYTQRIDYEDKNQPVYMGFAVPGTGVGSVGWQIRQNTFSGTSPELITAVLFSSGNTTFDKVWSSRSGTNAAYS